MMINQNSLSSIDKICDDNDSIDIEEIGGLINTTSYHKKFYFSRHNIYCMINCLDDWTVINVNMRYQSSNMVFYTDIQYNNDWI